MKAIRWVVSTLMLGGVLAPLGPHAFVHALSDAHFHRHENGVAHAHQHDADHHEHEIDAAPVCDARLMPTRATAPKDGNGAVLPPSAPLLAAPPQLVSLLSPSHLPGAPPGYRASPHLGRAPPA